MFGSKYAVSSVAVYCAKRNTKQEAAEENSPETVERVHSTKGAKQGHEAVPAGKDYTQTLTEQAELEIHAIGDEAKAFNRRVDVWAAVLTIASKAPKAEDVIDHYLRIIERKAIELCFSANDLKLPKAEDDRISVLSKKEYSKQWPMLVKGGQAAVNTWDQSVGKRLSDTRRVMKAAKDKFTDTVKLIEGPGTMNDKLAALPRDKRGRTKGTPTQPKAPATPQPQHESGSPQSQVQATANVDQLVPFVKELTADGLVRLAQLLVMHGKMRADYGKNAHFKTLIEHIKGGLDNFEARTAADSEDKGKHLKAA
jgi:hypothetical protein